MTRENRFSQLLNRWRRPYIALALIVFNTLLLLGALNLALAGFFAWKDARNRPTNQRDLYVPEDKGPVTASGLFHENGAPVDNGKRANFIMMSYDYTAFEGVMSEEEVGALLDEQWEHRQLGTVYQPWVLFAEQQFAGRFLNLTVDQLGFPVRPTRNPEPTKDQRVIRVFAFGGSTTFGAGVADDHTWSQYLSEELNQRAQAAGLDIVVEVTNYGRNSYVPTQEMLLLVDLLRTGHRPHAAIFMDGVNWGGDQDIPPNTRPFVHAMRRAQGQGPSVWDKIPMVRLVKSLGKRIRPKKERSSRPANATNKTGGYNLDHIVQRFIQSKAVIRETCALYDVQPLFFIQPDGVYNYPLDLYRFAKPDFFAEMREERVEFHERIGKDPEYISLTSLFEEFGPNRKALVDTGHYSPNFARFLASKVADHIDLAALADKPPRNEPVIPTGTPRTIR